MPFDYKLGRQKFLKLSKIIIEARYHHKNLINETIIICIFTLVTSGGYSKGVQPLTIGKKKNRSI